MNSLLLIYQIEWLYAEKRLNFDPLKRGFGWGENLSPIIFRKFIIKSTQNNQKIALRSEIERDYKWHHTTSKLFITDVHGSHGLIKLNSA